MQSLAPSDSVAADCVVDELARRQYVLPNESRSRLEAQLKNKERGFICVVKQHGEDASDTAQVFVEVIPLSQEPNLAALQLSAWGRSTNSLFKLTHDRNAQGRFFEIHDAFKVRAERTIVCRVFDPQGRIRRLTDELHFGPGSHLTGIGAFGDERWRKRLWTGLENIAEGLRLLHRNGLVLGELSASQVYVENGMPETMVLGDVSSAFRLGLPEIASSGSEEGRTPTSGQRISVGRNWVDFCRLAISTAYPKKAHAHQFKFSLNEYSLLDLLRATEQKEVYDSVSSDEIVQSLKRVCSDDDRLSDALQKRTACIFIPIGRAEKIAYSLHDQFQISLVSAGEMFDAQHPPHYNSLVDTLNELIQKAKAKRFTLEDVQSTVPAEVRGRLSCDDLVLTLRGRPSMAAGGKVPSNDLTCLDIVAAARGEETSSGYALKKVSVLKKKHYSQMSDRVLLPLDWFSVRQGDRSAELQMGLRFETFLLAENFVDILMQHSTIFRVRYERLESSAASKRQKIRVKEITEYDYQNAIEKIQECAKNPSQWTSETTRWLIKTAYEKRSQVESLRDFVLDLIEIHGQEQVSMFLSHDDCLLVRPPETITSQSTGKSKESGVFDPYKWKVVKLDLENDEEWIELESHTESPNLDQKQTGEYFARAVDHWAQVQSVSRRMNALRSLGRHNYLLGSLLKPTHNLSCANLYEGVPDWKGLQDGLTASKKAVIADILQTRPIYTLQGPPGTGKTTLVANFICLLLDEDPCTRILVAAKDHSAVDNMRKRFNELAKTKPNLANVVEIRYYGFQETGEDKTRIEVTEKTENIVHAARAELTAATRSPRSNAPRSRWLEILDRWDEKSTVQRTDADWLSFVEQVKRSANVVFATANAKEVLLKKADISFDWVIMEEAAIAHAVDMIPPLMAGTRWLLIGDHKQIKPFRYREIQAALSDEYIELTQAAIKAIIDNPANRQQRWLSDPTYHAALKDLNQLSSLFAQREWYFLFASLFTSLSKDGSKLTTNTVQHASAGRLVEQFRMHPDIAHGLVSPTFYASEDGTVALQSGCTAEQRSHPFANKQLCRADGRSLALVWLDIPFRTVAECDEEATRNGRTIFDNRAECDAVFNFIRTLKPRVGCVEPISLFLMSFYKDQVKRFSDGWDQYRGAAYPSFSNWKDDTNEEVCRTVTSSMGDECDIAFLSLVRTMEPTLYKESDARRVCLFVAESGNLNVAVSRAKRLLVVCGDWSFYERVADSVEGGEDDDALYHLKQMIDSIRNMLASGSAHKMERLNADE